MFQRKNSPTSIFLAAALLSTTIYLLYLANFKRSSIDVIEFVNTVDDGDIMAGVFWDIDGTGKLHEIILKETEEGKRDKFFLPIAYNARINNSHFDDTNLKGEYQKDVYILAKALLRNMALKMGVSGRDLTVIDVGCGSGWKLVHLISPEFRTIGIDTEPALSFLRKTYPDQVWLNSGKEDEALPTDEKYGRCDMGISADVVEHIRDPDGLMKFLKDLNCKIYVISTPVREAMGLGNLGPPSNWHHVREWTFAEFQLYLRSQGFKVIRSFNGVQHTTTQFHVVISD